jgi:ABC-type lipoprotein export system ATPase subunit
VILKLELSSGCRREILPLLIVDNVQRVYGEGSQRVRALRGVSLAADPGEFIALKGPSGCGKSTLLHLVGAMDRPTTGTITLDGMRLDQLAEDELVSIRRRRIGFVFQFFNLLPTLTVLENVTLPMLMDGAAEREARARGLALLDRVGISSRAHHFPAALSGGEMQRAAVARAVINQPSLLLADEPTGNLDTANGRQVMEVLDEMNRELAVTVILATHSDEAAGYAGRVISMRDGIIEFDRRVSFADERVLKPL